MDIPCYGYYYSPALGSIYLLRNEVWRSLEHYRKSKFKFEKGDAFLFFRFTEYITIIKLLVIKT